jgi:hypothetical protein
LTLILIFSAGADLDQSLVFAGLAAQESESDDAICTTGVALIEAALVQGSGMKSCSQSSSWLRLVQFLI